jgi:putative oxidoreductase
MTLIDPTEAKAARSRMLDLAHRRNRPPSAPTQWALSLTRWTSAVVFSVFGIGKFVDHASETASFSSYGLPAPGVFTVVIGLVELLGGVLLLSGGFTRWVALLLAGDMVGAIIVSGIGRGETVNLTLAPALLIAMVALVVLGPGKISVWRPRSSGHL